MAAFRSPLKVIRFTNASISFVAGSGINSYVSSRGCASTRARGRRVGFLSSSLTTPATESVSVGGGPLLAGTDCFTAEVLTLRGLLTVNRDPGDIHPAALKVNEKQLCHRNGRTSGAE
jgi:hypothetical protein